MKKGETMSEDGEGKGLTSEGADDLVRKTLESAGGVRSDVPEHERADWAEGYDIGEGPEIEFKIGPPTNSGAVVDETVKRLGADLFAQWPMRVWLPVVRGLEMDVSRENPEEHELFLVLSGGVADVNDRVRFMFRVDTKFLAALEKVTQVVKDIEHPRMVMTTETGRVVSDKPNFEERARSWVREQLGGFVLVAVLDAGELLRVTTPGGDTTDYVPAPLDGLYRAMSVLNRGEALTVKCPDGSRHWYKRIDGADVSEDFPEEHRDGSATKDVSDAYTVLSEHDAHRTLKVRRRDGSVALYRETPGVLGGDLAAALRGAESVSPDIGVSQPASGPDEPHARNPREVSPWTPKGHPCTAIDCTRPAIWLVPAKSNKGCVSCGRTEASVSGLLAECESCGAVLCKDDMDSFAAHGHPQDPSGLDCRETPRRWCPVSGDKSVRRCLVCGDSRKTMKCATCGRVFCMKHADRGHLHTPPTKGDEDGNRGSDES